MMSRETAVVVMMIAAALGVGVPCCGRILRFDHQRWVGWFILAMLFVIVGAAVSHAGDGRRNRRPDKAEVRVARFEKNEAKWNAKPQIQQKRNAGGRPWGKAAYYSGRAAFNLSGIPGQIIGGVLGVFVR